MLSCRAFGKQVERALLVFLLEYLAEKGEKNVIGIYRPSPKNSMTKDFYTNVGFTLREDTGQKSLWEFDLQLWHDVDTGDIAMAALVAEVFKVIYADSPSAQVDGEFRKLHPSLVEIVPTTIASDLQMIDANRVQEITFTVKYRTKLFSM